MEKLCRRESYRTTLTQVTTAEMTLLYNFTTPSAPSLLFGRMSQKIPEIGCTLNLQKSNVLPINSVAKGLPHSLFPLNGYMMFQVSGETNTFAENILPSFEKIKDGLNCWTHLSNHKYCSTQTHFFLTVYCVFYLVNLCFISIPTHP